MAGTEATTEPLGRISVVGNVIGSSIVVGNGNTVTVICAAEVGRRQMLDENPYRGLDAFDERSHDLFFGRERIVSELLDRMKRLVSRRGEGAPPRLLAILGPSGCGKSSIARAGLVPALASYSADAPELWDTRVIIARPGYDPVDALAGALARSMTGEPNPLLEKQRFAAILRDAVRLGRNDGLSSIVTGYLKQDGPVILVLDQFEETYALSRASEEVDIFVATLLEAATVPSGRVYLVLTLRSDFFGALARHQRLSSAVAGNHVIVPAMAGDDLRRAIERPAIVRHHPLDPATIQLILDQVEGEPAALPLVQFALQRIWDGATLPSLGGVIGALEQAADDIFDQFESESAQSASFAKSAFLHAVQLGDGPVHDTRRRAWLTDAVPVTMSSADAKSILARFVDARLLTMGTDAIGGPEWFELPHEALIRHWRRLRDWIDREREDLRFHRRACEAAQHWNDEKRPDGLLWRQPDLGRLREFHARGPNLLTRRELDFLVRSNRVISWARRARIGILAVVVAAVMTFFIVLWVVERGNTAHLQAEQSRFLSFLSRREAEQGNGMAAILLAKEALPSDLASPDRPLVREAQIALQFALSSNREEHLLAVTKRLGSSATVTAAAYSPDGNRILTGSANGNVDLWDARTGALRQTLLGHSLLRSIVFHPLKPAIALALTDDGVARVWDVDSGIELSTLRAGDKAIGAASFSADGAQILTISSDGLARLWSAETGQLNQLLPPDNGSPVKTASLSQNATRLLIQSDDGRLRLLDLGNRHEIWGTGPLGIVRAAGLSPDGKHVAALLPDGTFFVVAVDDPATMRVFALTDKRLVRSAALSPGLDKLAAVLAEGTLRLWDASTGLPIGSPQTEPAGLFDKLVFSGGGAILATTTSSKELGTNALPRPVRLWNTDSGEATATLQGHAKAANVVAISPDGTQAVTGSEDETARIWDARRSRNVLSIAGYRGPDADLGRGALGTISLGLPDDKPFAFSPDGKLFVVASSEQDAWLWDVARGKKVRQFGPYGASVCAIAFNPVHSDQFAAGASNGELRVWEASRQEDPVVLKGLSGHIAALSYSDDGRSLLAASWDGTAQIWDTATWTLTATLRGHEGPILAAAMAHDGRLAVTGSADGTARVWNTASGTSLKTLATTGKEPVVAVAFSAKGDLVTGSGDGFARLWAASETALRDSRPPTILLELPHRGGVLSTEFNAAGNRLLTTAGDGQAYLWNPQTGENVRSFGRGKGAILSAMFLSGDRSVAITTDDGLAEVSDAETGLVIVTFLGHHDRVTAAAFDPHARLLATASDDQTIKLWPVPPDGSDLLVEARRRTTRRLSPGERRDFFLAADGAADP